jgi:nicotinamidase/pyrazinamidase
VHCVAETWGAQLVDEIKDLPFEARWLKGQHEAAYSGFDAAIFTTPEYPEPALSHFGGWLKNYEVTEVDIVGIALEHCVKATALDAVKAGFKTRVLRPLTARVDPKTGDEALIKMGRAGIRIL